MASKLRYLKMKNVSVSDESSDNDQEHKTEVGLDLSLEKLNLGPKKKLLVLSLGGLLVHRQHNRENVTKISPNIRPDFCFENKFHGNFRVYKRPFCDVFLKFCFERFEVGLWSAVLIEHDMHALLNTLFGGYRNKLLFVWDRSKCTETGFKCLEVKDKPVFLKELDKVWEKQRQYSSSNTLLIDQEPYRALLNPPNTAIFTDKYTVGDVADNFLGPKGELQSFLDGLFEATNVPSYVKNNPFGLPAMTPSHSDWAYYSKIVSKICKGAVSQKQGFSMEHQEDGALVSHTFNKPVGHRKKLLVLALGGLLAYRVHHRDTTWIPANAHPDLVSGNYLVYKRPFCDDFLKFCFERFEVGIWSSARKYNRADVMNLVFREFRSKLLFEWGQEDCTDSGFESLEKKDKTIFFKDFRKILKIICPNCSWTTGENPLLNTLLVDDQPYKALLNPPNTAIFPFQFQIDDITDTFLGASGELRSYLDGISLAKDVPTYVKEHPYGQPAISPLHPEWHYYSKILEHINNGEDVFSSSTTIAKT